MSSGKIIDLRKREASAPRRTQPPTRSLPFGEPPPKKTPLRVRRRNMRIIAAFFALLLLIFCAWGVSYVSYLPQFSIQSVSVVGTSQVPAKLVSDYVETILDNGSYHLLSRKNIFLYPRSSIEKAVVGYFPRIKSASVSRVSLLATGITVSVEERQPYALWCSDSSHASCYQMDHNGFIFAQASQIASTSSVAQTQYVFEGGIATSTAPIGQSFVPAHLPGLVVLLQSLGQAGFAAQGISVVNDQDFSIALTEGFRLKASFGEDAGTLTRNLQLIISSDPLQGKEQDLEYIDLRFGDRVYYKLKGQTEATSTAQ